MVLGDFAGQLNESADADLFCLGKKPFFLPRRVGRAWRDEEPRVDSLEGGGHGLWGFKVEDHALDAAWSRRSGLVLTVESGARRHAFVREPLGNMLADFAAGGRNQNFGVSFVMTASFWER